MLHRRSSLAAKIASFIAITVAFVVVSLAIVDQRYLRTVEKRRSLAEIENATKLIVPQLQADFDKIARDLEIVAFTPPIQGIIQSRAHGEIDPRDGSTTDEWRARLGSIFISLLEARKAYTQIRFISVDDNGREVVRVNRSELNGIEIVPPEKLQTKSHTAYFQDAMTMSQGEYAFSEIQLNMENKTISPDSAPTIRAYTPVFGTDGEYFGFLVINERFENLARTALNKFTPNLAISLIARDGTYYRKMNSMSNGEFQFSGSPDFEMPELLRNVYSAASPSGWITTSSGDDELTTYYVDVQMERRRNNTVRVATSIPTSILADNAAALAKIHLWISVSFVALAILMSWIFGHFITAPLLSLNAAIQKFGSDMAPKNLPVSRKDEIGEIARSFEALTSDLGTSRESERRALGQLQAVFNQTIDSLITIDRVGIIQSINPAGEQMFGYSADELVGRNVKLLMQHSDANHHDKYLQNYRNTGEATIIGSTREVVGMAKNGDLIDLELSISEVVFDDGNGLYTGMLRDISSRKAARERLKNYAGELKQANCELTGINRRLDIANDDLRTFTYIVSHDLRAPLVNLQGFSAQLTSSLSSLRDQIEVSPGVSLLPETVALLDNKIPTALTFISKSATKIQSQLDSILEISRLGRYELEPRRVNLAELFTAIFEVHLGDDWADTVSTDVSSIPDLLLDRKAIEIICTNLCSNAIKYKSNHRSLSISVSGELDDKGFTLCVADNGRGMSEEEVEEMFKLFRRCGRPDTDGEGIGLTYSQTLVARLEGRIWCDSALDVGTSFYVFLPYRHCRPYSEAA